jgi:hypothetical protein
MERTIMNARMSWMAGALLATAAVPWAACAADAPADAPVIVAQASTSTMPAAGCPGDTGLTGLERRLLSKYDRDAQSMLDYVWLTRNIYLLERYETLEWAQTYRQAHPAC